MGGKWAITIDVESEDDIIQNGSSLDLKDPEVISMLEVQLETEIKEAIEQTLNKAQEEIGIDALGF